MVLSNNSEESPEESLAAKHADICNKLGLDIQALNESWDRYQAMSHNFTLEGDPLNWIGCAIFETCWKSNPQATSQNLLQGRGINLITILKYCSLSVSEFFDKMHNWCEMTHQTHEFRQKVLYLQNVFHVSFNIFKTYQELYQRIFKPPEPHEADIKQHRNRKQKPVQCTPSKVFEFCWNLFITIKAEQGTNELVPLCHLLRAVCDWAFQIAFNSDRKDLLNPSFEGLPSDWSTIDYVVPNETPCIVNVITSKEHFTDVKYIKEYQLKPYIKNFFDRGVLVGKDEDGQDVFDNSVFESNFRHVSNTYETHILNKGEFDERIFLADFKRRLLEREQPQSNQNRQQVINAGQAQDGTAGETPTAAFPEEMVVDQQTILTPLTGRRYLGPREPHNGCSAHSSSTENITRLQSLLSGRQAAPGNVLVQLFESCQNDPTNRIADIISSLGDRFVSSCGPDMYELARKRLQCAVVLFYKLIESVLINEKKIHPDLSAIVEKDIFFECMFACSMEIIVFTYKMPFKFPWILEILGIQAYNFVKVIELIIRSKDQFSRDIIKHLNIIEERIIASLVWKSESILWSVLENSKQDVPKFEETALPTQLKEDQMVNGSSCAKKILGPDPTQSPNPSATDRFHSPVSQNNIVSRQLFPSNTTTHLVIKDQDGVTKMIPIVSHQQETPKQVMQPTSPVQQQNDTKTDSTPTKPKRTGGLSIIFRKYYNLAGERMEHLCNKLSIDSLEVKRKIWTIFEESVRLNNCELMRDRDLDQLLMCAVYMVCKLNRTYGRSFSDVMKSYRTQPQAHSDIYRKVLVAKAHTEVVDGKVIEHPEDRTDLITFYNKVIIKALGKFAEKFSDQRNETLEEVPLSPLPASRRQTITPSVQIGHNVFVKPLESPRTEQPNGRVYNYIFSRSPSKDLKDINRAIKGNGVIGKRLLVDADMDQMASKRTANRKVQSLIEERKNLE